ncbi:Uncharacterised protein [uncultured archaeon]|nr:Uncharacterised protein [uncultured archaeon]
MLAMTIKIPLSSRIGKSRIISLTGLGMVFFGGLMIDKTYSYHTFVGVIFFSIGMILFFGSAIKIMIEKRKR